MGALLDVILPVFLVLGAGYTARWRRLFSDNFADGLMTFANNFAIPCLLFLAISRLDLAANMDVDLLASFYIGVLGAFIFGAAGARAIFRRTPEDSVAIGFSAFFSNSVLLGLAITQRAYGEAALGPNYAIIAFHAPLLYTFGIIVMELVKTRGQSITLALIGQIIKSLVSNPILIGLMLGLAVNITGAPIPETVESALDMIARAALPAALFGLGAVLFRYRPEGDIRVVAWIGLASLILHPAICWVLGRYVFDLDTGQFRSLIITSAMAPGVNTYLFANMYGTAKRVAASAVLICTGLTLITAWGWLAILP